MRDPRHRFWAWLNQRPFLDDAAICGALFFVIGWPLFAIIDLAGWAPFEAFAFAVVYAFPMGAFTAYRRRKRSAERS